MAKVNVLKYIGAKESGTITVAPVKGKHPDRFIKFVAGQTWFVGCSIGEQAAKYLAYNFASLFEMTEVDCTTEQMLIIDLDNLYKKYIDKLSDLKIIEIMGAFSHSEDLSFETDKKKRGRSKKEPKSKKEETETEKKEEVKT